jgi:hypothetical protein
LQGQRVEPEKPQPKILPRIWVWEKKYCGSKTQFIAVLELDSRWYRFSGQTHMLLHHILISERLMSTGNGSYQI